MSDIKETDIITSSDTLHGMALQTETKIEKVKKPKEKPVEIAVVDDVKKEKLKALQAVITACDKEYGTNTVMRMDASAIKKVPCISTGILGLDDMLGGGFARGRIAEILGMESSGKSTLCIETMIQAQKEGGVVGFIDAEHALDLEYAKNLGLNVDELFLTQPDSGEVALEVAEKMIETGMDLLVIDSVAALTPQSEIDGDMGDANMGKHARLMSQACRKLTAKIAKSKTVVLFTNQYRSTIGVFATNVGTGGNALKFYASQRVDMRKGEVSNDSEEEAISNKVKIKIIKNKIAPPFRKGEFEIVFGKGFDKMNDLVNLAVKYEVIDKKGAWYAFKEEKLGQGLANTIATLNGNIELKEEIVKLTKEKMA